MPLSAIVSRPFVRLEPISAAEYEAFIEAQTQEYADQKIRAGHWRPEEAIQLSRHTVEGFLPRSGPTPGHRVWKAVNDAEKCVAWVWVGPPPVKALNVPTKRWLYQITVEPEARGAGYGRATLAATEAVLAAEGVKELSLNVFRWNTIARALYDSAGYEVVHDGETDTGMRKTLRLEGSP